LRVFLKNRLFFVSRVDEALIIKLHVNRTFFFISWKTFKFQYSQTWRIAEKCHCIKHLEFASPPNRPFIWSIEDDYILDCLWWYSICLCWKNIAFIKRKDVPKLTMRLEFPTMSWGVKNYFRGQFHQHFTRKLLIVQIPKAQKDTDNVTEFLRFWDLCA